MVCLGPSPTNHAECLDQSRKNLPYLCAPNDIWSLGVILVNLACGRNPWKQASSEDATYRAFLKDRSFLKTILPISDELNHLLARVFERDPQKRLNIQELRREIEHLPRFGSAPTPTSTPPLSPCVSIHPEVYHAVASMNLRTLAPSGASHLDSTFTESPSTDSDLSDESDGDYDSGYDSPIEQEVPHLPPAKVRQPAPLRPQYLLPSPDYAGGWCPPLKHGWTGCATSYEPSYDGYHSYSPYGVYPAFPTQLHAGAGHCY